MLPHSQSMRIACSLFLVCELPKVETIGLLLELNPPLLEKWTIFLIFFFWVRIFFFLKHQMVNLLGWIFDVMGSKTTVALKQPCCCCEVTSVVSDSVQPHRRQSTRLPVPGILQARTLEWVSISFSNPWNWKMKVKSLCRVRLLATPWTAAYQAPPSTGLSGQEY